MKCFAFSLALFLASQCLAQQEAMVVLRSTVTGNQEQPKVLYLVPWHQPDGPDSLFQPMESMVNDVSEPIDREEFVRELKYRQMLKQEMGAGQGL